MLSGCLELRAKSLSSLAATPGRKQIRAVFISNSEVVFASVEHHRSHHLLYLILRENPGQGTTHIPNKTSLEQWITMRRSPNNLCKAL